MRDRDATIPEDQPRNTSGRVRPAALPLFCLAPHGVFRASQITPRAVSFYLAFSPLPVPCCQRTGGLFSVTLSVTPLLQAWFPRFLRGMLPYGVRTFLSEFLRSDHLPSVGILAQDGSLETNGTDSHPGDEDQPGDKRQLQAEPKTFRLIPKLNRPVQPELPLRAPRDWSEDWHQSLITYHQSQPAGRTSPQNYQTAPSRLRLLALLGPSARLVRNVMSPIKRALHPIVFGCLASRSRRQRGRSRVRSNRLGWSRRWFIPVLAQIDKHNASDQSEKNETTHAFFGAYGTPEAFLIPNQITGRRLSDTICVL